MPGTREGEEFMRQAISAASLGMHQQQGGPFGAVIVRDGEIIGRGCNQVTSTGDPTAHAEIVAIRAAARELETFTLAGCSIYASCEPCPMCLGAIYWARLDRLYFACTRDDAAEVGFDDARLYRELPLAVEERSLPTCSLLREEAWAMMQAWVVLAGKTPY